MVELLIEWVAKNYCWSKRLYMRNIGSNISTSTNHSTYEHTEEATKLGAVEQN